MRHRLPDDCFRYRKRKQISIDGVVGGLDHHHARGSYAELPVHIARPGSAPADYLGPVPQHYDPQPGFAAFPEPEYESYEAEMQQLHTPPLRAPMPHQPGAHRPPGYSNCLMTDELFDQAMQECTAPPDISEPIPADHDVRGQGIMNSHHALEDLAADPFSYDPMQEIEAAIDQQMEQVAQPFEEPMHELEPPPQPEPPEQMYEDPWMMDPFGMPDPMGPGPMM